jgi:hypothetical protein
MKIIQSYWTKPNFRPPQILEGPKHRAEWLHQKYLLMSWALSCLQLRTFYHEVELITDDIGKSILIDQLDLPYTNVDTTLNDLDNISPDMWAYGKIMAYRIQTTPFIHIDGDVYIWEKLPQRLEAADLIAQHFETALPCYETFMEKARQQQYYLSESILKNIHLGQPYHAYNAGILGGNNLNFFRAYTSEAIRLLENNQLNLTAENSGMFNLIFEQHLFYCMSRDMNLPVECYTYLDRPAIHREFKSICQFRGAPETGKFIHLFGGDTKQNLDICEELSNKLKKYHPEYYTKITRLFQ